MFNTERVSIMTVNPHDLVAQIEENIFAPEIFSSLVSQFSIGGGNVTLKLVSVRYDDSTAPPKRKPSSSVASYFRLWEPRLS
jgi:hypothetical protein